MNLALSTSRGPPLSSHRMKKTQDVFDVLVLGNHPASYFAAVLTASKSKLRVGHVSIPDEHQPDRLCLLNPRFFTLDPSLAGLKKKLAESTSWGVEFLSDDRADRSAYRAKAAVAMVVSYAAVRDAIRKLLKPAGIEAMDPAAAPVVTAVDETGMNVGIWRKSLRTRSLIVTGPLGETSRKVLGIEDPQDGSSMRNYTFARLPRDAYIEPAELAAKPVTVMSLDLAGTMQWAWLIAGKQEVQLAVATAGKSAEGKKQLSQWAQVLHRHGRLRSPEVPTESIDEFQAAFAGALDREGVANRALLIGPAGGFFSATGEDIYPNCWSAVFAAETMVKALKEPHLQDALQAHRQRWGATLGDYLRGPQQNLRFLMTMIYRNPVMTERMAESILLGKPVVR